MTPASVEKRYALIGYGAITAEIVRALEASNALHLIAGVLVRQAQLSERVHQAGGRFAVVDRLDAMLDLAPTHIAECAGHAALREFGPAILERGFDLIVSSVGVLADRTFSARLARALDGRAKLSIPSGAIAGIDGLLAARTAGLRSVTYTSVKPPVAWKGTPAESRLAGSANDERTTFFEGTAREAALAYPQNANVGATVALAGLGLDRTRVRLVSDPVVTGPLGIIEAAGDFGSFRFEILAYAARENPKTSTLTAHSILLALRDGFCFSVSPETLC